MGINKYINNRLRLVNLLPDSDAILIVGNGSVIRTSDTSYPFRQDSNILYFTGIEVPSISLFIDVKNYKSFIVVPRQNRTEIIFEGETNSQKIIDISGCEDVIGYDDLINRLKACKNIYSNLPAPNRVNGSFNNGFRRQVYPRLVRNNIKTKDIRPVLANLRMIKQDYEINDIKKAVNITKKTLKTIEPLIWQKNQTEQSLAWAITAEFAKNKAGHGYSPIVATGPNASTLHINPGKNMISNSVLFDVGAEYNGYSADISRTYFKQNSDLYKSLAEVQSSIIDIVRPGILFKDIHKFAVSQIADLACKFNLNEPIESLFPHSIGHHLGLDTHDLADYKNPLQENMIITIEPGIYSKQKGFGMRIEDDILVTGNGSLVL
jgi:Xaa-Pro aminopeptidase